MILFLNYQKLSQLNLGVKISYDILTPSLDIFTTSINRWKSFVCIPYQLDKIVHYIIIISMISWIAFILTLPKLSQLDPVVKISYDILTPLDIFTPLK